PGCFLLHYLRTAWGNTGIGSGRRQCGTGQCCQLCAHVCSDENVLMMDGASVRIDKWLWAARFFKTRSQATDAVDAGRVRLGGERLKPARAIKPGDLLQIDNGSTAWE